MQPSVSLKPAGFAAPLVEVFGERLTFARIGNGVCWDFDGQTVLVDLRDDASLDARFLAEPAADAARAVYRSYGRGYAFDSPGTERMIADIIAFFRGVREPRFLFVDVI